MRGGALRRIVTFESQQQFLPSNAPYVLLLITPATQDGRDQQIGQRHPDTDLEGIGSGAVSIPTRKRFKNSQGEQHHPI